MPSLLLESPSYNTFGEAAGTYGTRVFRGVILRSWNRMKPYLMFLCLVVMCVVCVVWLVSKKADDKRLDIENLGVEGGV